MTIPQYPDLGAAMRGVCQVWCNQQGYSDPFSRNGEWWAFPPHGVMPVRIATVMDQGAQQLVKIGPLTLALLPDGSVAKGNV
ncbi:MAG: hypothetical protein AAF215_27110 [Cyanobacteria bacterium P01_A01_bin.123]